MSDPLKRIVDCAPNKRFVVELPNRKAEGPAPVVMTDAALAELVRAVAALIESQKHVTEALVEATRTMREPVKPIYDGKGKLIGAQRVMTLEKKA